MGAPVPQLSDELRLADGQSQADGIEEREEDVSYFLLFYLFSLIDFFILAFVFEKMQRKEHKLSWTWSGNASSSRRSVRSSTTCSRRGPNSLYPLRRKSNR